MVRREVLRHCKHDRAPAAAVDRGAATYSDTGRVRATLAPCARHVSMEAGLSWQGMGKIAGHGGPQRARLRAILPTCWRHETAWATRATALPGYVRSGPLCPPDLCSRALLRIRVGNAAKGRAVYATSGPLLPTLRHDVALRVSGGEVCERISGMWLVDRT